MAITQNHVINIQPGVSAPLVIHCSQGDTGTQINLTVVNGDEEFDCSSYACSVHGVREDGANFGPFACTLSGSKVTFPLHSEMTAAKGSALAEIVLVDNGGNKVGSANFGILVEQSVFPLGVTYDNDASVYESILAYVQTIPAQMVSDYTSKINEEATARKNAVNAVQNNLDNETNARTSADTLINARIDEIIAPSGQAPSAAEVQDIRVKADGTTATTAGNAVREQITELKNELNYLSNVDVNWKNGYISIADGQLNPPTADAEKSSNFIPVSNNTFVCATIRHSAALYRQANIFAYAADKTYISRLTYIEGSTASVYEIRTQIDNPDISFVRISYKSFNDDLGTSVNVYPNISNIYENIKTEVTNKTAPLYERFIANITNIADGYIGTDGEIHASQGDNYSKYTKDYFAVTHMASVTISVVLSSAKYRSLSVFGYDKNQNFIARIAIIDGGVNDKYSLNFTNNDSNVQFIRFSLSTHNELVSISLENDSTPFLLSSNTYESLQNSIQMKSSGLYNYRDAYEWQIGTINTSGVVVASSKRIVTKRVYYANSDLLIPVNTKVLYYLSTYDDFSGTNPVFQGLVNMYKYAYWRINYIIPKGTYFRLSIRTDSDDIDIDTNNLEGSFVYKQAELYDYYTYTKTVRASNNKNVISISHQGLGENPENKGNSKPSAIRKACAFGFDYIETDIWFSSDNIPVCCHDQSFIDLNTGDNIVIAEHTAKQLKRYNFFGETILTFDELTAMCKNGGVGILVDHMYYFTEAQCNIVFSIVKKYSMQDLIIWFVTKTTLEIFQYIENFYNKSKFLFSTWSTDLSEDISIANEVKTDFNTIYIAVNSDVVNSTTLINIIANAPADIEFIAFTVDRLDYLIDLAPYVKGMLSNTMNFSQYRIADN